MACIVYGLFDPRNGELRYVGKTERSLTVRLQHHIYRARADKSNTYKATWIRSLLRNGLEPEIVPLEEVGNSEELREAEYWNIAYYRSLGCRLTNLTDGGEGALGYRHTEEAKRKMSELLRGKPSRRRGIPQTKDARLKCSMAKTGLTREQCDEAVEFYRIGASTKEVGERFGISPDSVCRLLRIYGVPQRDKHKARRALTDEQEAEIAVQYAAGKSARTLAAEFGVSDRTVRKFLKRNNVAMRSPAESRWLTVKGTEVPADG